MSLVIRQATPADGAAVAQLNQLFNGVPADAQGVAARIERCTATERVFLAEVDGLAVGFLSLWLFPIVCYPEPYAEVSELYVCEGYRQMGVGTALMREAIEVARVEGAAELKVNTGFRNTAAQRLYTALGFENLCLHLWTRLGGDMEESTEE
ncbi:MAG: GNAT family N-acetyltransferase [Caldilinea sp.]|nr:GNAT family N-acetyltransferase [Caldilinea sp.]